MMRFHVQRRGRLGLFANVVYRSSRGPRSVCACHAFAYLIFLPQVQIGDLLEDVHTWRLIIISILYDTCMVLYNDTYYFSLILFSYSDDQIAPDQQQLFLLCTIFKLKRTRSNSVLSN